MPFVLLTREISVQDPLGVGFLSQVMTKEFHLISNGLK